MFRRRGTAVAVESSPVVPMTSAQLQNFWVFYRETLKDGTLQFEANHPYDGNAYQWMFVAEPEVHRIAASLHDVTLTLLRLPQMRPLPTIFRTNLEDPNDPDPTIFFLTIEHDDLDEPIRACSDVKDFILGGVTYPGFPFELVLLSDGEEAPGGSISVQNVDRRIGLAVKPLTSAPLVTLDLYAASDWDLTVDPRVPLGTPSIAYHFTHVYLREIQVDAQRVSGSLRGFDFIQEPWPSVRATQGLTPAIFR